ncbi:MAG: glyoxylate/hydroxypyruvate reductase A [Emcibacter sp.]|nr:glyoxylate/hydroxypyruvate reductase A [Emcibacter sp.]
MTLLILMPDRDVTALATALNKINPDLDIRIWPEVGPTQDIEYVIVWNHPSGELNKFPNLKVIASYGAGVDHILKDPDLPEQAIITRLVDDSLSRQMCEYIAGVILNQRLRLTEYREYQAATHWSPKAPRSGNVVCLLGLGNIGLEVARYLTNLNFTVRGWSQSPKDIDRIKTFHGPNQLDAALTDADYIVCLLPLTPQTTNILDKTFFHKTKKGAYLINVGRGGHLNEDDLMDALYQEQLSGACLDVFRTEPLPEDHPFWRHPRIYLTPHSASVTNIGLAARKLYENYLNMQKNLPLLNRINMTKGY